MSRRQNVDQTWIKNHPLEGDGLVTGFYNFLFKRNTKTLKPCKDVFIPDTIVFDHNFPRGWYTSDLKAKEISKRQGRELDADSIGASFASAPSPNVQIVASYMCSYEVENDQGESEMCTQVEFFNETTLKEFVARKTKREGILQRFLVPKGKEGHNSVIQAIWSPLIFSCKRRTNVGSVKDKVQCERDPYPVAVTYEGPSHFSEEGNCAVETTAQIKDICKNIVEHFHNTEHKYITRMVLYFKVDEHDQLWLLWCGSLRVSDRGNKSQMPVNLAAVFSSPSLGANSPQKDDKLLREADLKHLAMTNDAIFYETYVRDHVNSSHGHSNSPTKHHTQDAKQADAAATQHNDGAAANASEEDPDAWKRLPGIVDQYRELCSDRELVLSAMEDIFYEAYGHFLRHDPGPFVFQVDRKVAHTLSEELLHELMQNLRIEHTVPSDDAAENDELWFSIPRKRHTPTARLGDEAARWIEAHYAEREQELKDEAATAPTATKVAPVEEPPAADSDSAEASERNSKPPTPPAAEAPQAADEAASESGSRKSSLSPSSHHSDAHEEAPVEEEL